jgi:hypothetical protein
MTDRQVIEYLENKDSNEQTGTFSDTVGGQTGIALIDTGSSRENRSIKPRTRAGKL